MIGLVLTAGGLSTRFGSSVPKVLLPLAGKPVFVHALEAFRSLSRLGPIVITAPEEHIEAFRTHAEGATVIPGGATRQASVTAGVSALPLGTRDVLVHDAARPLVTRELIDRVIHAGRSAGAALPVVATTDSLHELDGDPDAELGARLAAPIDRRRVWRAQTPQFAERATLAAALTAATRMNRAFTDEVSLLWWLGQPARAVLGSTDNIKITWPQDLRAAEALFRRREAGGETN